MKLYKPGKKELVEAAVVAVLLIVISYARDFISPYISPHLGALGEFGDLAVAAIVGFLLAMVLTLVGFGRYAALAFVLAVAVELARVVKGHIPEVR